MKTLAYCRVSRREQAEGGHSLDAQREAVRRYCEFREFGDVDIFVDAGVSAGLPLEERPEGAKLLDAVGEILQGLPAQNPRGGRTRSNARGFPRGAENGSNPGKIAVVAVKLDRLFRDACDCLSVTASWDAAGVGLHLLDLGLDTSSPMGRAFLTMAAAFAELERNINHERTIVGLDEARRKGIHLGRVPIGFQRGEDKRLEVNPDTLATARRLVALRVVEGWTLRAVAEQMDAEGWPTSRGAAHWQASSVRDAIKALYKLPRGFRAVVGLEVHDE